MRLAITPLGDSALVVRVGDSLGEILAAQQKLAAAKIPGVIELAPAFASVGVFFSSPKELAEHAATVKEVLRGDKPAATRTRPRRIVEIPVCYEPEYGPDLEAVSRHAQLSPNEISRRHASADYFVRCVGFTPGFPYLSGLPRLLATPRKDSPRVAVPPGSVAIGGSQTGIYPLASPGGWNIIGRTPLRLFDTTREPAALLQAGDRVRFLAITRAKFLRWQK